MVSVHNLSEGDVRLDVSNLDGHPVARVRVGHDYDVATLDACDAVPLVPEIFDLDVSLGTFFDGWLGWAAVWVRVRLGCVDVRWLGEHRYSIRVRLSDRSDVEFLFWNLDDVASIALFDACREYATQVVRNLHQERLCSGNADGDRLESTVSLPDAWLASSGSHVGSPWLKRHAHPVKMMADLDIREYATYEAFVREWEASETDTRLRWHLLGQLGDEVVLVALPAWLAEEKVSFVAGATPTLFVGRIEEETDQAILLADSAAAQSLLKLAHRSHDLEQDESASSREAWLPKSPFIQIVRRT